MFAPASVLSNPDGTDGSDAVTPAVSESGRCSQAGVGTGFKYSGGPPSVAAYSADSGLSRLGTVGGVGARWSGYNPESGDVAVVAVNRGVDVACFGAIVVDDYYTSICCRNTVGSGSVT